MEYDSPYGNKYADLLSNVSNFNIIESTLREGEQFANAFFNTETKIKIAKVNLLIKFLKLKFNC